MVTRTPGASETDVRPSGPAEIAGAGGPVDEQLVRQRLGLLEATRDGGERLLGPVELEGQLRRGQLLDDVVVQLDRPARPRLVAVAATSPDHDPDRIPTLREIPLKVAAEGAVVASASRCS